MSAPPTVRLDHDDPLRLAFEATVVAHARFGDASSVVLDRSAFFPEGGGQMGDRGVLDGSGRAFAVDDVQIDDQGVVHHLVTGPLPPLGAAVAGRIDAPRRRQFMALHTAQHLLSRALVDVARAETVSARLGETACTVDLEGGAPTEADLARAEALVNAVIDEDRPVRAWFPDPGELAGLPLRRAPKVAANVRVVDVGGFDCSPCGGTHCTRTAQVGLLVVRGVEKYKGKLRVTFDAGHRARGAAVGEGRLLRDLARDLTCGVEGIAEALGRVRRDLGDAARDRRDLAARLAGFEAERLTAAATGPRIVASFAGLGVEFLRAVAGAVLERRPEATVFLADAAPEGLAVLVARGAASAFDCGAFLKGAAVASGGRGGGRPERAEGRLPAGVDWASIAAG